jgi:hypothetical protein
MSIETMTKLFTTTVGAGGSASVTFSNIPQNYTDLCIKISCRTDRAADEGGLGVQLSSATTGQTYRVLAGSGSDGTSSVNTAYEALWVCRIQGGNAGAGIFSSTDLHIPNYSGNAAKIILADSATEKNATIAYITMSSVLQSSPAPVTSITLSGISGTFQQHSTFTLYGVKNAAKTAGNSIKATGGNIVFDGTYVHHVFPTSGAFVANQSLTIDVVSVGGGGGGGWNNAGGGGGGEVDISRNLSVAAGVSKTVTIGAGGATATSTAGAGANGGTTSFSSDTTSLGGGGGGTSDATDAGQRSGQAGGSGGGSSINGASGGAASGSNTNIGGTGYGAANNYQGGGGGGATSAGSNASSGVAGNGGQGIAISTIFSTLNLGALTHLASGGGGGGYLSSGAMTRGFGGTNGGNGAMENSASGNADPTAGTSNSGGGGGGGAYTGVNSRQGGAGGSGIVIIRYKG